MNATRGFPLIHGHVQKNIEIEPLVGFSTGDYIHGEEAKVLIKGIITSDNLQFYQFMNQITAIYLNQITMPQLVSNLAIIVHPNKTADIYINDVTVSAQVRLKTPVEKNETINRSSIIDIVKIRFDNLTINPTDHVVICIKNAWKFILFFDFSGQYDQNTSEEELGRVYKLLTFQEEYSILENDKIHSKLLSDGWFPFIELLGSNLTDLGIAYQYVETDIPRFTAFMDKFYQGFDSKWLEVLYQKWLGFKPVEAKKELFKAGIDSFLQQNYTAAIKTLYSEIEGLISLRFHDKFKHQPSFQELKDYLKDLATSMLPQESLGFPSQFINYLNETFFKNFNVEANNVPLSRHSVNHGVADSKLYTREKALQAILIVDQLRFFLQ